MYTMDDFVEQRIMVLCETQAEYDEFMGMCDDRGLRWRRGDKASAHKEYFADSVFGCLNQDGIKIFNGSLGNRQKGLGYNWSKWEIERLPDYYLEFIGVVTFSNLTTGNFKISLPKKKEKTE